MDSATLGKLEFGNLEQIKAIKEMEKEAFRKALRECFPDKAIPKCPDENKSIDCPMCGSDFHDPQHEVAVWGADNDKAEFYCETLWENNETVDCAEFDIPWRELKLSDAETDMLNSRCGLSIQK